MGRPQHFGHVARLVATVILCTAVYNLALPSSTTFAQTNVNAKVRDDQPAGLKITSPRPASSSGNSAITISGTVHNVSQIMVYVDGVYSTTIPLDFGAATYSFSLVYSPGFHVVRLVGIDPITSSQVEETIDVTYDPTLPAQEPTTTSGSSAPSATQPNPLTHDGVVASGQKISESAGAVSQEGIVKSILDGVFGFMVAADIVVPGYESQPGIMALRFLGVTVGLVLLLAPWWSYRALATLPLIPVRTERTTKICTPVRITGAALILLAVMFFP